MKSSSISLKRTVAYRQHTKQPCSICHERLVRFHFTQSRAICFVPQLLFSSTQLFCGFCSCVSVFPFIFIGPGVCASALFFRFLSTSFSLPVSIRNCSFPRRKGSDKNLSGTLHVLFFSEPIQYSTVCSCIPRTLTLFR